MKNVPLDFIELRKGGIYHTGYSVGESVYLKHDPDQHERMITAITIRPHGMLYELGCGTSSTWHSEIELTNKRMLLNPHQINDEPTSPIKKILPIGE